MERSQTKSGKLQSAIRLRQVRKNARLTQERFAELLDISVSAYQKIERGENQISIYNLVHINQLLGVSADFLLFGDQQGISLTWNQIMHCSEVDKMYLLLRLLLLLLTDTME